MTIASGDKPQARRLFAMGESGVRRKEKEGGGLLEYPSPRKRQNI